MIGFASVRASTTNAPGLRGAGQTLYGFTQFKSRFGGKSSLPRVDRKGKPIPGSSEERGGTLPGLLSSESFTHKNILTTYFWVGETAGSDNGGIPNAASTWDELWSTHFGGIDDPTHRNGYKPAGFTPKENPFYFALPYSDLDDNGNRKLSASSCPNAASHSIYSWCKNSWIAISHNGKIAYAQWEDAGPFGEDDVNYVFGSSAPKNTQNAAAGLDVSPAVRDYLGLGDVDRCDWQFVPAGSIPAGPWKEIITTTPGNSAH